MNRFFKKKSPHTLMYQIEKMFILIFFKTYVFKSQVKFLIKGI